MLGPTQGGNMLAVTIDQHTELSHALYRQRNGLVNQFDASGLLLANVEARLQLHLFFLSQYIDPKEVRPQQEYRFFTYLSRRRDD